MIDLLKQSSEHSRSVLKRQIQTLEQLLITPAESRNEQWHARYDFALALARDVIRRSLPPDSAFFDLFTKQPPPKRRWVGLRLKVAGCG